VAVQDRLKGKNMDEEKKQTAQEAFDSLGGKSEEAEEAAKEAISKGKDNPKVGLLAFALKDELEAISGYLDIADELKEMGDKDGLEKIRGIVYDEVRHCKTLKGMLGNELVDTDESKAVDELDEDISEAFANPAKEM
jgi:rubrerythrin